MTTYPDKSLIAETLGVDEDMLKGAPHTRLTNEQGSQAGPKGITLRKDDDGNLVMGYITHDDSPSDYWTSAEGLGEFREFTSQDDQDEWIAEQKDEGKVALIVNKYEHGNVHYSVAGTVAYHHGSWDSAPRAVFVPCDYVQEQYQKKVAAGEPEAEIEAWLKKDSNGILDEYSTWCNGGTYCIVSETWEFDENTGALTYQDYEVMGGYIGLDVADGSLDEILPEKPKTDAPEPA
jgi:hypothetical protein